MRNRGGGPWSVAETIDMVVVVDPINAETPFPRGIDLEFYSYVVAVLLYYDVLTALIIQLEQ